MAVRALVFDVFGTLVDWRSGVARAFCDIGVDDDADELADEWRGRFLASTQEVNQGVRPWGNVDDLHRATLEELSSERGLKLDDAQRRQLVSAWHRLDPWPDASAGLEELRRQRPVSALSNGHTALLVDLGRHGGLRFDCLLSAELVQVYKPAREVYQLAPRLLGLVPGEVMLVAAHPFDLAGAREAGLRSAFVDRPLEYGPGSAAREDPDADYSVGDLRALAKRLT